MGLAASHAAWGADPTLVTFDQAATVRPRNWIEAATPPIDTANTRNIDGSGTDWAATSAMIASVAVVGCS